MKEREKKGERRGEFEADDDRPTAEKRSHRSHVNRPIELAMLHIRAMCNAGNGALCAASGHEAAGFAESAVHRCAAHEEVLPEPAAADRRGEASEWERGGMHVRRTR